jgi:hypothetical protein
VANVAGQDRRGLASRLPRRVARRPALLPIEADAGHHPKA